MEEGVTQRTIRLGSILALRGQEEALGNNLKLGLKVALNGQLVKGKKIEIIFENDYYEPPVASQKTKKLIDSGILLMIGNVGTPTAKVTLPILKKKQVPAVGFLTGAQLLRDSSKSSELIINYRASYTQEIEMVVKMALKKGIKPSEICAYVQDDSYGMSGLEGLRESLKKVGADEEIVGFYDQFLDHKKKEKKGKTILAPVGLYKRNTPYVKPGYDSLKQWEKTRGINCKLVVTAGTFSNIARFIKLAQDEGNNWLISSLSFADAQELKLDLEEYGIKDKVIMTQVVPLLKSKSDLPIVKEAKSKLKSYRVKEAESKVKSDQFNNVFLEGYIVGKMTLKILQEIPGKINRENFLKQIAVSKFDLGGVRIDLTKGRTQASDLVLITELTPEGFRQLDGSYLAPHDNWVNNRL
ncbi:MAG: ABC transporter substrate-binding protein [Nostocaceae cyanobacterium]|nr:ABC transporter substrate-binding protein [Nostocaceae cyanobacterium]